MLRFVNICLVLGLVALAYVIYQVKYESRALDAEIATLGKQIDEERDAIAVLRAEWSLLNRPERIERLAQKYLKLAPARPVQLVTVDTRDRPRFRPHPARGRCRRSRRRRRSRPSGLRPSPLSRRPGPRPPQRPGRKRKSSSRSKPPSNSPSQHRVRDRETRCRHSPRRASLSRAGPLSFPARLPRLRACLRPDRRPARDARLRRHRARAAAASTTSPRPCTAPTFSTATAACSRPTSRARRSTPTRRASSTWTSWSSR